MVKKLLSIIPDLEIWWWAAKSTITMGNKFIKEGYSNQYLTFYNTPKYNHLWHETCLNQTRQRGKGKWRIVFLWYMMQRAFIISKLCKKNNIDICISHIEEANFSTILSKIVFKNKCKIIVQNHVSMQGLNIITKLLIKILYPYADQIVSISKEWANELNKIGKTLSIYNNFDSNEILTLAAANNPLKNKTKFTFITIGRLCKQKNQTSLLDAFDMYYKKNKDIQLLIIGNGELEKQLINKKNTLKSKNDIHFLPTTKNPYTYLKNSDCFVFSSIYEWLWRALIEATICWVPIISTDCPIGTTEILSDTKNKALTLKEISIENHWILVPTNNTEQLYLAMKRMYEDKSLRENIKNASKKLIEKFDIDIAFNQWKIVFDT